MDQNRSERASGAKTAPYISSIARQRRRVKFDIALLRATDDLRFYGKIITEYRENAILTATTMSKFVPLGVSQQLLFFVDGSRVSSSQYEAKGKVTESGEGAGAAVVYRAPGREWMQWTFRLADGLPVKSTEETAIAKGLEIAVKQILDMQLRDDQRRNEATVVIFTDCTPAMDQIAKLRRNGLSRAQLRSNPILCELVMQSQNLRSRGVGLEIRWVPGHSGVEGNELADTAARRAAGCKPRIAERVYSDAKGNERANTVARSVARQAPELPAPRVPPGPSECRPCIAESIYSDEGLQKFSPW